MKLKLKSIMLSFCFLIGLSGCAEKEMKMHGKVMSVKHMGFDCFVFRSDEGRFYEIVTASTQILREGMTAYILAERVNKRTICELGDTIRVLKYRPDDPKPQRVKEKKKRKKDPNLLHRLKL